MAVMTTIYHIALYLFFGTLINFACILAVFGSLMLYCRKKEGLYDEIFHAESHHGISLKVSEDPTISFFAVQALWPVNVCNTIINGYYCFKRAHENLRDIQKEEKA